MALLAPFARPFALRLRGDDARPPAACSPLVPPFDTAPSPASSEAKGSRTEVACFLAHALLTDSAHVRAVVAELESSIDADVVVWSPCLSTASRAELLVALLDGDDAITDVEVSIVGTSTSASSVLVEWRLEGRFNNAGFLNDDLLVEPSGGMVEATGVLVVVFDGDRATRIRCYYDSLGLLEQVIRPTDP